MLKKVVLLLSASLFLILMAYASAPSAEKAAGSGQCVSGQTGAQTYAASCAR